MSDRGSPQFDPNWPPKNNRRSLHVFARKEDELIVDYLIDNKQFDRLGGNEVWKTMCRSRKFNPAGRPYQGLRERFLKHIVKRLHLYSRVTPQIKARFLKQNPKALKEINSMKSTEELKRDLAARPIHEDEDEGTEENGPENSSMTPVLLERKRMLHALVTNKTSTDPPADIPRNEVSSGAVETVEGSVVKETAAAASDEIRESSIDLYLTPAEGSAEGEDARNETSPASHHSRGSPHRSPEVHNDVDPQLERGDPPLPCKSLQLPLRAIKTEEPEVTDTAVALPDRIQESAVDPSSSLSGAPPHHEDAVEERDFEMSIQLSQICPSLFFVFDSTREDVTFSFRGLKALDKQRNVSFTLQLLQNSLRDTLEAHSNTLSNQSFSCVRPTCPGTSLYFRRWEELISHFAQIEIYQLRFDGCYVKFFLRVIGDILSIPLCCAKPPPQLPKINVRDLYEYLCCEYAGSLRENLRSVKKLLSIVRNVDR